MRSNDRRARADYGLDAPGLVKFFAVMGPILIAAAVGLILWQRSLLAISIANTIIATGLIFIVEALAMWRSSRVGKLKARDWMLDGLALRGDESVLDVGCGRGLLLIGAARRLPNGRAVGIDLWSQQDLGDNRKTATLENARIEGVADRVEVADGDMRKMPFLNGSFDAVVASNSIHNIYDHEGRKQAIGEIVRVLKPGGQVALLDIRHTAQYADDLRAAGMKDIERSRLILLIFPPVRVVRARK